MNNNTQSLDLSKCDEQDKRILGFFTGLIVGDGYIDKKGINKRGFKIKSIDNSFINYIKDFIDTECKNLFQYHIVYTPEHFSCGCNHKDSWELAIRATEYFNNIYNEFYSSSGRIVTESALSWLTPEGIANWYMSDGYVCLVGKTKGVIKNRRMDICTDRYKLDNINQISNYFNTTLNISTSVIKRGSSYRLRISVSGYENFINLIKPFIVDSMLYKLYLGYEKQQTWGSKEFWDFQNKIGKMLQP